MLKAFIFNLPVWAILGSVAVFGVYAGVRDGDVDPGFSVSPLSFGESANIRAFAPLPDGKILVGGGFSSISGAYCENIARLNPDGTFDSTFTGQAKNGVVLEIFPLSSGKILISGDFTEYAGVAWPRLARINSDGSLDTTFNLPTFGTGFPRIIAVQPDGKLIVSGNFTAVGGVPRAGLARLFADGMLDTSFEPGTGSSGYIDNAVVLPDGKIVVAGKFNSFNGVARPSVARLNTDGSLDTGFAPSLPLESNEIFDMSLTADGKLYLVGWVVGERIYRLAADGTIDATFDGGDINSSGRMYSVKALPDGGALVGGQFGTFFTSSGSVFKPGLVRFNTNGSIDNSFSGSTTASSGSVSGSVRAISAYGTDQILVGGDFGWLNGFKRGGVGRISLNGTSDPGFVATLASYNSISAIHLFGNGKILAAGNFEAIGTSPNKYAAMLNEDGSPDPAFSLDSRVDGTLRSICPYTNGRIMLGGNSGESGFGQTLSRGIYRINANGSLDTSFDAQIAHLEAVSTIAVQTDGKILIGGSFSRVNGILKQRIARLNPNGSLDNSFEPELNAFSISVIKLQPDGKILVGGTFSVFGNPTTNVVRLNADGSIDNGFNIGNGANNVVGSIQIAADGRIYLAGAFSQFNGSERRSVVRLMPDGTFDPTFKNPRIFNGVSSVALQLDGKTLLAGDVVSATDTEPRQRVIRLLQDGSIDFSFRVGSFTSNPGSVYVDDVKIDLAGRAYVLGRFNGVAGTFRQNLARLTRNERLTPAIFDFDGDGRSDVALYRPSTGTWFRGQSFQNRFRQNQWGTPEDRAVAADYDGDYVTDVAVFRPSNGAWYILKSSDGTINVINWGTSGDLPVPADRDGDNKADLTVFRPSNNNWYTIGSANGISIMQFGEQGDKPVTGDFDADGLADIAIYRPSNYQWHIIKSNTGYFVYTWGDAGDIPVPADYDGDGSADVTVFRPANGQWWRISGSGGIEVSNWGVNGDKPVPADYDGDGKTDKAVFRPATGQWWLNRSSSGMHMQTYGVTDDIPIPNSTIYAP